MAEMDWKTATAIWGALTGTVSLVLVLFLSDRNSIGSDTTVFLRIA